MADRLSCNTLFLLLSNVGSAGLSFLLSVLIGRALGEGGLGTYATALAWVFPLSLLAEFGLGTLITRDVAQNLESGQRYLRATTIIRLWLGGGLVILLIAAAPLLSDNPAVVDGLRISAPLILILPLFGTFTALFRAHQAMAPIPWLNLGMLGAQIALTALVFLHGGDVIAALSVNVITSAGQLTAAWMIYRCKFKPPVEAGRERSLQSRVLLRRALPFAIAAILAALQTRMSTILLERLTSAGEVGYYTAASRFVEAGRMIPNAFFGALFPTLAAAAAHPQELHLLFARTTQRLAVFGLVLALVFTLLGPWIVNLTFGEDFVPSVVISQVLMWALLPALLRAGRTLYWYALGQETFVNSVTGVALALQVVVNLLLIPHYGALGAAGANMIVELIALALLWRPLPMLCYARR